MTPTRKHRLLLIAQTTNANQKRWYSQYCKLNRDGLTGWQLGSAYLTEKGKRELAMFDLAYLDRDLV